MAASMVTLAGTCATLGGEPRQTRKGAAVATDAGAVVLLVKVALINFKSKTHYGLSSSST